MLTAMLKYTSGLLIAKILPNIKLHTSVFIPVVKEVTATPIASAELDISAIALSLFILLLFPIFNNVFNPFKTAYFLRINTTCNYVCTSCIIFYIQVVALEDKTS